MNILELDSYNLDDAVKFNDRLNPKLWDSTEHLKPEVKAQLLMIAEDFREFLGVTDLDLQDITISGSNAAYTYTPNSDIDLHLVVKIPNDPVYRELFDAKKFQYNEQHNIKIGGYDVELYVQDANQPHISQGIYSILNDDWIQVPRRVKSAVDDTSTENKFKTVGHQIEKAIASGSLTRMTRMAEKIKKMRQTGLEQHGEFGPENLAFKMLRTQGKIKELYDARNAAKDQELSLRERRQPHSVFTYGFKHEEADPVVEQTTEVDAPSLSDEEILKDFIRFCVAELKIKSMPTVKLRRDPQWSVVNRTFGRYINDAHLLEVAFGQRHIMDVLRTVAHELTHKHQHEREAVPSDAGETGSPYENEANARAGILMRDYGRLHPELFDAGQTELEEGASGYIPTKKQAKDPRFSMALTKDIRPGQLGKEANKLNLKTNKQGVPQVANPNGLFEELMLEFQLAKEGIDAPISKIKDAEQYYKFILAKHKMGRPLTRKEQEYVRSYKMFNQQVAEDQQKIQWIQPDFDYEWHEVESQINQAIDPDVKEFLIKNFPNKQIWLQAVRGGRAMVVPPHQNGQIRNAYHDADQFRKDFANNPEKIKRANAEFKAGRVRMPIVVKTPKGPWLLAGNRRLSTANLSMNIPATVWIIGGKQSVVESTEVLDEVKMSPTALQKWAKSPEAAGIRAGFEAELIFRDTNSGDDSDYDMEPDYDMDERCRSIQQILDFFNNGEYGGLTQRQEARLQEGLDEQYYEWYDEQMQKDFADEAEDLIRKVLVDEGDWDLDNEIQKQLALLDLTDDEMNDIINAGERAPKFTSTKEQQTYAEENPLYQKYLDAQEEAEGLLDDLIADEVRKQGANWDAALDDFRDNYQIDDDSGFFNDAGLRWMSDVANEYDLDWPYMTGSGSNGGSREWDEIGDSLHSAIDMPVKVSSNYHSTPRREGLWIVEPDTSLQPDDSEDFGLEIVSPPLPLEQALEKLEQVCDWANSPEGNCYTNSSTGLHMGVSVPFKGGDVDYLKLILFLGDEYVLRSFGREANTYTKSAMSKFKENIKGGRSDPMSVIKLMQHGLLELAHKELQKGVGTGKYTSAHIQQGYIEFRSAGGDWLAEENADPEKLSSTMLRFARAMSLAANPAEERREYAKKLYKLVAPEGDSQLALFSQFAAGELTAEQLKKRWAEKTIGTEKKMNQRFRLYQKVNGVWEPVPGAEWNGYSEDQVKNAVWSKYGREALDTGEYQLVNMGEQDWEVYDVNTGKTLEIVKGKSKGEVADAVYDKYVDQGIGFNVRPYEDPAKMTPRAKLAKRIVEPTQKSDWDVIYKPTGRVIDNILRVDKAQAEKLLAKVAVLHDFKNADDLEIRPQQAEQPKSAQATTPDGVPVWEIFERETGHVVHKFDADTKEEAWEYTKNWLAGVNAEQPNLFSMRPKMNAGTPIKDITPDVAQNFNQPADATNRVGSWSIYDVTLGREISRMDNVPWSQADARANELERSTGHNISVRGLSENFADGKGPGRPGDSVRHGIPKGATMAQLEKASHAKGRKGQLARWQLNMRRGKKK